MSPEPGAVQRAALTMVAVLGALGTVLAAGRLLPLPPQVAVLAVVLTLTLSRVPAHGGRARLAAAVELPLVALVAGGVGWLVVHEEWVGQPLLVAGLSAGILARRYGPGIRRAGRLVALPFLALLVTPVPVVSRGNAVVSIVEGAGAALVAVAWTAAVAAATRRSPGGGPVPDGPPAAPARTRRRLDAPTRMAVQMAAGLSAALVVGHLLFGERWVWTVLSAFLVASGNRGRGDVVHKAGLRVLGAGLGTVAATLAAVHVVPGNRTALVLLFAVMAVALVLRQRSYAFWAAGVTAMVALLHSYYGISGTGELGERLVGVLLGCLIGVAAAWFVLPLRTADVLRRRLADCLAALTDDLADPAGAGHPARLPGAVASLEELLPTLRAHSLTGRAVRSGRDLYPLHAVLAVRELAVLPEDPGERRRLRAATVRVRRALVGKDDPAPDELPPALATVHRVLQEGTAQRLRPSASGANVR